jgi:hypothetical protein
MAKLNRSGSRLEYSTYLGGSLPDYGLGIAVDAAGGAHVTGTTASSEFPTTPGAFDASHNGGVFDAFVTKLSVGPGAPAMLTLSPKADANQVGTEHCVSAGVDDAAGNPSPDVAVRFSISGSVHTSGSVTTGQDGKATFCYRGPDLPGADAIAAFADTDADQAHDQDEPSDGATKVWTLPVSTPLCKVTGGGLITARNGDRATFAGNAESDADHHSDGQQSYRDHGPAEPIQVRSIEILGLTCNAERTRATIFGRATINDQGSHAFRIDVQDLAEPGRRTDTYRILVENGYDSGEAALEGGNVQVH